MTTIKVIIRESNGREYSHTARTDDLDMARYRAIKSAFGPGRSSHRHPATSVGKDELAGAQHCDIIDVDSRETVVAGVFISAEKVKPFSHFTIMKLVKDQYRPNGEWCNTGEKLSKIKAVAVDEYRAWRTMNPGATSCLMAVNSDGTDGPIIERHNSESQ